MEVKKCSNRDGRPVFAKGLCKACYAKQWRASKNKDAPVSRQIDSLEAVAYRQMPALRKAAIRRLLDHGLNEAQVYDALASRPELRRYVEGLNNAHVAIR